MATLLNWLEDPLSKKSGRQNQAQPPSNIPRPASRSFVNSVKSSPVQSQPRTIGTQKPIPSSLPKAPFKTGSNLTLKSLSTNIKSPTPQLHLQTQKNSPRLNTPSNQHSVTTLSQAQLNPTPSLPTALKQTNSVKQQDNNSQLTLERANQAKQRYDSLRDNNNEFWNQYKSALATTKDQYKNIFGESTQQRSAKQLGSSLKKLETEQGSLPSSGEEFVNKYRNLSDDDKWDVWQNLQKAKTTLTQAIGKADDEGQEDLKNAYGTLLSEISVYNDMIAGEDRGRKSFGKSFGDWITSGGMVGNMAEPATNALGTLTEIMGNKGGAETARAISERNAAQNAGNNKVFDAINFTGSTIGNIATNMITGGASGLVNAGLGLADSAASAITDRNRNYYTDADGNLLRENQSTKSKLAGLGNSALSAGLTVAGMKGFGPNINFKDGQTLQGLLANKNFGEIGKALGRYTAKEVPFALATTAASQGISVLGGDKDFIDGFGTELANNIVGDLAVDLTGAVRQGVGGNRDLFKPGDEKDPSALQVLAKLGHKGSDDNNSLTRKITSKVDDGYTTLVNKKAVSRLAKGIEQGADGNIKFVRMDKATFNDINNVRKAQGLEPLTRRQVTAYQNAVNNNLNNRVNEGMSARRVAQITYNSLTNIKSEALPGKHKNTVVVAPYADGKYDGTVLGRAQDNGTSLKSIEPRTENFVKDERAIKNDLLKGQSGSPLTANQEGSVTQPRTVNSAGSSTSLGSQRPESPATPLGVLKDSISQSPTSVNLDAQLNSYYKKYGNDFYDHLPDNLQTRYDSLLDNAPRSKDGTYTDPITGEKWIDETIKNKAKSSLDTIKNIMTGSNQRLAYAGGDGSTIPKTDISKPANTNMDRNFSTYKGQDGKIAVKIDDPTFLNNTPVEKYESSIRKAILAKFQGKKLKVGQTDNEALVSGKTAGKISRRGGAVNDDVAYKNKGEASRQLDELVSNLHNIRTESNNSDRPQKRGVASVTKGEIEVDINGNKYYPTVVIRNYADGSSVVHEISNIKRTTIGSNEPVWSDNFHKNGDSQSPNEIISQSNNDVNLDAQLNSYYKKYGNDFYDHLPDNLQTRYDSMLDNAPRSKDGTYTDPITGEKWIDETTEPAIDTKEYIKSQVAAQKAENKTPLRQKAQDTIDNLKHYLVDDAVAYERYVKDKGDRLNLREGIDRVRTSDTIAKQMIDDSGLSEAIGKMSTADANEFQQYLIAKRSQELKRTKGADFRTGRNDVADQALIKSVGNKYASQEKVVREFNQKMLDYAVDSGLISKKLRDQLVRDNTDYVPMNRVLDNITDMGVHKSKQLANLGKQNAVQKIEGSDRIVQNPLESMIRNAIRTVNEGERNKVAKQLSETAAFREARLPEGAKPKPGNDKLSFIVNGEKISYEVPALVAKEMKGLNGVMPDFAQNVIKVLGAPTKVLRTGATGANPMFAVSNLIRDQLQTTITGSLKTNLKGTPKALKATFSIGKDGKAMQAELARNGIIGSEYRQTYGYKSGELVKELQQSHQLPKQAWEKLKHPIDTIADVIGKTEYFTRAQQYFGTDGTVAEKSQAARNNTLNFGRAGATVRVLNKVIPFLNAGVQGGRITVNQFKERPVRTTMAVAAFAGVAAAVRGVNSAQDQELWDRIGDEEKQSNLIIFGNDAHYDPATNRVVGILKIPLPQMVYPITDAVNNLKGKSEDLLMLGGDIFTAITGIDAGNPVNQLLPTAVKPFVETAMNKNTYTGQEIVSEYDSNLNPEDKGKKYTTGVARSVAKITGVDAPIIDNFIQNWGGGLFKDLTKVMTDNPDNKSDGGGIGEIFSQGAFRRFLSSSVESQYDIQATLAEDYKQTLKADPTFQALDANEQKKALDRIDTDTRAIAGFAAKTEQGRSEEITSDLSKRQKALMQNGFDVNNYNQPSKSSSGHDVEISDSLSAEHKKTLDTYNSMEKEEWNRYLYSVAGRSAEYQLAAAKLENDKANGKLTEVQELKRQKELRKLKVSQAWDKEVRDAYSLAGSKTDMQALLNELDNREDMVGYLNALNRALYDSGVITASTYKSRNRNINNLEGSSKSKGKSGTKSAYSAASRAALSAYTKSLASGNNIKVNSSPKVPSTKRRMNATTLATNIKKSNLGAQAKVTVKKGIN